VIQVMACSLGDPGILLMLRFVQVTGAIRSGHWLKNLLGY